MNNMNEPIVRVDEADQVSERRGRLKLTVCGKAIKRMADYMAEKLCD
jgi:hypothetical protein